MHFDKSWETFIKSEDITPKFVQDNFYESLNKKNLMQEHSPEKSRMESQRKDLLGFTDASAEKKFDEKARRKSHVVSGTMKNDLLTGLGSNLLKMVQKEQQKKD